MAQEAVKKTKSNRSKAGPRSAPQSALQKRQAAIARLLTLAAKNADIVDELEGYCEAHTRKADMKALLAVVPARLLVTALEKRYDRPSSNLATLLPADVFFGAMLSSLCTINSVHATRFNPERGRHRQPEAGEDLLPPQASHKVEGSFKRPEAPASFDDVEDLVESLGDIADGRGPRAKVSRLAHTEMSYHIVLTWFSAASEREDLQDMLRQSLIRGRRTSLNFMDLVLIAIWEQQGFPEDAEIDESVLFEYDLAEASEFDAEACIRRLRNLLPMVADMTIDRLEEARDELIESLGSGSCQVHS